MAAVTIHRDFGAQENVTVSIVSPPICHDMMGPDAMILVFWMLSSQSLLKLISILLVTPSNNLLLCHPLLLFPSIFPRIRVFPNESVLHIRWPKFWSFSFSISTSNEYLGLIFFRISWFDLFIVQGTLKLLLQHLISKHQFFSVQFTLWSNSHFHSWLLEKP